MKQIWIVEDDQSQQFIYSEVLAPRYSVHFFKSKDSFFSALTDDPSRVDLFIVDIMLEDGSILNDSRINQLNKLKAPFIFVSSLDDMDILKKCFALGAQDFLAKPFNKNELIVKVDNVLKDKKSNHRWFVHRNLKLNVVEQTLTNLESNLPPVRLTPREMQIFCCFYNQKDSTLTRKSIIQSVWGTTCVAEKTFDVHIHNLRCKVESIGVQIQNINFETYRISCEPKTRHQQQ